MLTPSELSKLYDLLTAGAKVGQIEKWMRAIGVAGVRSPQQEGNSHPVGAFGSERAAPIAQLPAVMT
jgi:hypothetical protein